MAHFDLSEEEAQAEIEDIIDEGRRKEERETNNGKKYKNGFPYYVEDSLKK